MSEKVVFFVDKDGSQVARLTRELEPHRAVLRHLMTPAALFGAHEIPAAIVLCIDGVQPNGWTLCSKVKRNPALQKAPVIVVSSSVSEGEFRKQKMFAQRDDFIRKPVSVEVMVARIAKALYAPPARRGVTTEPIEGTAGATADPEAPIELTAVKRLGYRGGSVELAEDYRSEVLGEQNGTTAPMPTMDADAPESIDAEKTAAAPPPPPAPRGGSKGGTLLFPALQVDGPVAAPTSRRESSTADVAALGQAAPSPTTSTASAATTIDPPPSAPPPASPAAANAASAPPTSAAATTSAAAPGTAALDAIVSAKSGGAAARPVVMTGAAVDAASASAEAAASDGKVSTPAPAGEGGSRRPASSGVPTRELLQLREQLHAKDREILKHLDTLAERDHQILDLRKQARELERARAELHERVTTVEKDLLDTCESLEAVQRDLDGARRELAEARRRYDADFDAAKQVVAEAIEEERARSKKSEEALVDKYESAMDLIIQEHGQLLSETKQQRDLELSSLRARLDVLEKEHAATVGTLAETRDQLARKSAEAEEFDGSRRTAVEKAQRNEASLVSTKKALATILAVLERATKEESSDEKK